MNATNPPPILSIVGWSDEGKTTLLEKIIPELGHRGFRVGTIKHDSHGFDLDRPGKDSWRHKKAGAAVTVLSSPLQVGLVMDVDHDHSPRELISFLGGVDIILTEGYKREAHPKIEVFRAGKEREPACKGDRYLLAIVTDEPVDMGVPRFSMNDPGGLVEYVIRHFNLIPGPSSLRVSGRP